MPYYIIHSKSAKESGTLKSLRRIAKKCDIAISFRIQEKEMINHTKVGRILKRYNLMPGYIFARSDEVIESLKLAELTRANDFFRFLSYSDGSITLRGDDERYASQMFDFPQVIKAKNVFIKSGSVIIVSKGAFTSFKGKVIKIDMKRERVDVEIELMGKPTIISLPVDHIEDAGDEKKEEAKEKGPVWEVIE